MPTDTDARLDRLEAQVKQLETEVREFIRCLRQSRLAEVGHCEKILGTQPTTASLRRENRRDEIEIGT